MSTPVTVRVVPTRPDRRFAWLLSLGSGLLTLAVVFYVIEPEHILPITKFTGLGGVMTLWCLGTLLGVRPRRPKVMSARVDAMGLALGGRTIPRSKIRGVRAVRGRFGYSVAIDGESDFFLEVEREEDARHILTELGATWPGSPCFFRLLPLGRLWVQYLFGVPAVAGALGYMIGVGILDTGDKALFGLMAIIGGIFSSLVFIARPVLARAFDIETELVKGIGATAKHFELHRNPSAAPPIVTHRTVLERQQESTRDWLARVDRLGESGGYREEAAPQPEELVQIAEDRAALPAARLAAARLLARRHGGLSDHTQVRVAEDLGERARIVIEADPGDVADKLEKQGPVFDLPARARR